MTKHMSIEQYRDYLKGGGGDVPVVEKTEVFNPFLDTDTKGEVQMLMVKRIDKPWGYEEVLFWANNFTLKRLHIVAGQCTSLQYHERKSETMTCYDGSPTLTVVRYRNGVKVADVVTNLVQGVFHSVLPGEVHRLSAGADDADVLEMSYGTDDDIVRLDDRYGRKDKGAKPTDAL